jgi:small subunit ribosomal protein S8
MSMTDPLADMLTRIANAQQAGMIKIELPASRIKAAVCKVLKDEGYIENFEVSTKNNKSVLAIDLKYYRGRPVIESISRVSRPGKRIYRSANALPSVLGGLGIAVISTSKGVMADREARQQGQGGEVLCMVS